MKNRIQILITTFLLFFIISIPHLLQAQTQVHVYDAGEKTYHTKKFKKRKKKFMLTATERAIYQMKRKPHKHHKRIYNAPAGTFIQNFSPYARPDGNDLMLVIRTDNMVDQVNPNSGMVMRAFSGPSSQPPYELTTQIVGDDLWAMTNFNLVYMSSDSGTTWTIDTAGIGVYTNALTIDSFGNAYVSGSFGIKKQIAGSNTWTVLTGGTTYTSWCWIDDSQNIWRKTNAGTLQVSVNGGNSFITDSTGLMGSRVISMTSDSLGNYYAISLNGFGSTGNRIYRQSQSSTTWTRIDQPIFALNQDPMNQNIYTDISSDDTSVMVTTYFGTFISDDQGTTWTYLTEGMEPEENYSFIEGASHRHLVSTNMGVFYNDVMMDTIWHHILPLTTYEKSHRLFKDSNGNIYTQTTPLNSNGDSPLDVKKSSDNGLTWTSDTLGIYNTSQFSFWVDENGTQHEADYGNSTQGVTLYKKTNSGSYIIDTIGLHSRPYAFPATFGTDGNGSVYFSSTDSLGIWKYQGNTWTPFHNGMNYLYTIYDFAKDHNGNMLGGTYNGGLWRETGGNWSQLNFPNGVSSGSSAFVVAVDTSGNIFTNFSGPNASGNFIGRGVFSSSDNGNTWVNLGVDTITFRQLVAVRDTVFGVSYYNGIWKFVSGGLVGIDPNEFENMSVSLFPNPASDQIVIEYSDLNYADLRIFNDIGQLVDVKPNYPLGTELSIDKLPPGEYFIWMHGDHFQKALKFIKQ